MKKPSVSILLGAVIAFALSVATAGARTAGKSTTAAQGERAIESLDDTAVAVETHADALAVSFSIRSCNGAVVAVLFLGAGEAGCDLGRADR